MIDLKGLRGFRPDQRRIADDPDETEGRALYRAHAERCATLTLYLSRVSYRR